MEFAKKALLFITEELTVLSSFFAILLVMLFLFLTPKDTKQPPKVLKKPLGENKKQKKTSETIESTYHLVVKKSPYLNK